LHDPKGGITVIRVLLAHGSPLMRAGICAALAGSRRVEVVAEVGRAQEVLPAVEATSPDVVLVEAELDGALAPAEVVRQIQAGGGGPSVVILARAEDPRLMRRMFGAGAAGWLSERASPTAIVDAVEVAAQGQELWTPGQLEELARRQREIGSKLDALTPREREVLELIAEGLTNRQIAGRLVLAPGTVEVHVRNVPGKLGVDSRVEAAVLFLEHRPPRARGAKG
jgi:DNA-binding NarL/FixJ family response regulator